MYDGVDAYDTCFSGYDDVSDSFYNNWSSGNTSIVTVDYYGTHSGVSVGSTVSQTHGPLEMARPKTCIVEQKIPSGGANVTPFFLVGYNAFIAVDHIKGATTCTWAGTGQSFTKIYIGDQNRGTYRTAQQVHVAPELQNYFGYFDDTGETRNYGAGSPANGSTLSSLDEDGIPNDCYLWNNAKRIYQPFDYNVTFPYSHQAQVQEFGSAYNPLENPSTTITWDMRTVLDTTNPLSPTAYVNYNHTCYPAHQIKVNGQIIYSYFPPEDDPIYIFDCLFSHINKIVGQTQPQSVPTH